MKRLGKQNLTQRGFPIVLFRDRNEIPCSLQVSSSAVRGGAVWLGSESQTSTRMHLTRHQVKALIAHLEAWMETGDFER